MRFCVTVSRCLKFFISELPYLVIRSRVLSVLALPKHIAECCRDMYIDRRPHIIIEAVELITSVL